MELTLEEFRKVIPKDTSQDDESHHSWGAVLYWLRNGKTYEEHQPDIPTKELPFRWFVN
ncbi:hypothetical protein LCGC14_2314360 [marine sediment metagenome]|uniref:Uncharacterized protein n=1 Tax=marine sediment metagenome TaxID=412755 RepID=A0A0F9CJQ0_9ZZZZ